MKAEVAEAQAFAARAQAFAPTHRLDVVRVVNGKEARQELEVMLVEAQPGAGGPAYSRGEWPLLQGHAVWEQDSSGWWIHAGVRFGDAPEDGTLTVTPLPRVVEVTEAQLLQLVRAAAEEGMERLLAELADDAPRHERLLQLEYSGAPTLSGLSGRLGVWAHTHDAHHPFMGPSGTPPRLAGRVCRVVPVAVVAELVVPLAVTVAAGVESALAEVAPGSWLEVEAWTREDWEADRPASITIIDAGQPAGSAELTAPGASCARCRAEKSHA